MRYSPEELNAFVEAADAGSFSAAARRLKKSQSTISAAIANLEADLGIMLFDRSTRHPTLTVQGRRVLIHVREILSASEKLDQLAIRLQNATESRLTFVLSDTFHPNALEALLREFDQRFPDTEFECLIGEEEDVIDLLQKERAAIGLIEARESYPPDIRAMRLNAQTQMGLYVAPQHPLAQLPVVYPEHLNAARELCLSTYLEKNTALTQGIAWSAPNYLLLLSMAVQGLGWSVLPSALVDEFCPQGKLVALNAPGWPKLISVDVVWSTRTPPGPAGCWIRDYLLAQPKHS